MNKNGCVWHLCSAQRANCLFHFIVAYECLWAGQFNPTLISENTMPIFLVHFACPLWFHYVKTVGLVELGCHEQGDWRGD